MTHPIPATAGAQFRGLFRFGFRAIYRISRTFDDAGCSSPGSVAAAGSCQAALSTRARRSTNPARPYI